MKLILPASMINVSLIGESRDGTIITYADNANIDNMGTFRSYTFLVHGDGFRAYTLFINCQMDGHIRSEGWHIWDKEGKEEGIRYLEYNNTGEGAIPTNRVRWSRILSEAEADRIT